jgi:hypothetical protein
VKTGKTALKLIAAFLLIAVIGALSILAVVYYQANKSKTFSGAKYININI